MGPTKTTKAPLHKLISTYNGSKHIICVSLIRNIIRSDYYVSSISNDDIREISAVSVSRFFLDFLFRDNKVTIDLAKPAAR